MIWHIGRITKRMVPSHPRKSLIYLALAVLVLFASWRAYKYIVSSSTGSLSVVYTVLKFKGSETIRPFQFTMACAVPDTLVVNEEYVVTCDKVSRIINDEQRTLSWGPPQHLRSEVHGDDTHFRMLTSYEDLSNQSLAERGSVTFRLFPTKTGEDAQWLLSFVPIADLPSGEIEYGNALDVQVPVKIRESWLTIARWMLMVSFVAAIAGFLVATLRSRAAVIADLDARIAKAESNAEMEPEKAKFAWDLARVKLEAYFDRNLSQVNQVFVLAVAMIAVGFAFVLWGITLSIGQPKLTPTSAVAAAAGIITQFIGATVMVIYRSTMAQANEFMGILERINTVGMAIQVLDSIPEGPESLKNETRANIIGLLLSSSSRTAKKMTTKKSTD
jgi:hypothetical protein